MTTYCPGEKIIPFASTLGGKAEEDILQLVADHRQLGALCDLLECCADGLPALPPVAIIERICGALTKLCEEGEPNLPPYLEILQLYDTEDPLAAVLVEQVHARRFADATHAQDLVDALRGDLDMADRLSSNTLGYMLRCFFDGSRQAMDCEELAILTLARHRLSTSTRSMLIDSLRVRARGRRFSLV